jgi:pimeloyl-ACP methyl ester carboxylesterase
LENTSVAHILYRGKVNRIILPFCFLVFSAIPALSQSIQPGPQVVSFLSEIDDSDQPYALYVPKDYTSARAWPVVISLHGAWSNHRLNLKRVLGKGNKPHEADSDASRSFGDLPDVPYIIASPWARGTTGYRGVTENDVLAVLADVKRRLHVDEDRVYLTGLSMGGGGTLELSLQHPDLWAAVAPVCPVMPEFALDLAVNYSNLPVFLHHGTVDSVVPIAGTRKFVSKLRELGISPTYREYPGVDHNAWDYAYADASIFQWFSKFQRNRFPDHLRYASLSYHNASAYWVRFDRLEPGTAASIDANFIAANSIDVKTADLQGFTLLLAGHPQFTASAALRLTLNGVKFSLDPGTPFSFRLSAGKWEAGLAERSWEGGIVHVFGSRHVYVYGTAGEPSPGERMRRENEALQASEWYGGSARIWYFPRVVADVDVTEFDLKNSNLVLFGNAKTNSMIAKLGSTLPLQLADSTDVSGGLSRNSGLAVVVPGFTAGRLALVLSGASFIPSDATARVTGYVTPRMRLTNSTADYLLFRGQLDNILAEGRFDSSGRLLEAGRVALDATRAVAVH